MPGLAGVLTVLVTWLWGRAALGGRAAWCGAAALVPVGRVSSTWARILTPSTACWLLWVTAAGGGGPRRRPLAGPRLRRTWWLLSALACGLGVLTKGPVALVLVVGPLLAFRLLDRRCPPLTGAALAGYLATAAGVAAPWFVAVARTEPGFLGEFLWRQHVMRFLEPFDHQEPVWFFLPGLLLGLLPWTLLLPGMMRLTRTAAGSGGGSAAAAAQGSCSWPAWAGCSSSPRRSANVRCTSS